MTYRKKMIEVSIPLDAINAESSREKSIRHGHPSTLHLWWARRPLAACRAVIFCSLIDDPGEETNLALKFSGRRSTPPPEYDSLGKYVAQQKEILEGKMQNRHSLQLAPDQKKMLESLGYLGGRSKASQNSTDS